MSTLPTQYVYAGRVLLTVLVINWSGLLAYVSNAQSATDSPNQAPSPANPRQDTDQERDKKLAKPQADESKKIVENMENSFKVLEAAEAEIPRDTFDAQAIVSKVGKDPNNLFEWVRDNTFWVPYRGSLRGSLGVLMDRLGNSLDRSLLLAELLHVAGHEVRLAHAEISPDQGKELLPKLRPVPDVPVPPGVWATHRPEGAELDTYAAGYHLDAAELRESSKRTSMATANLTKQV